MCYIIDKNTIGKQESAVSEVTPNLLTIRQLLLLAFSMYEDSSKLTNISGQQVVVIQQVVQAESFRQCG